MHFTNIAKPNLQMYNFENQKTHGLKKNTTKDKHDFKHSPKFKKHVATNHKLGLHTSVLIFICFNYLGLFTSLPPLAKKIGQKKLFFTTQWCSIFQKMEC
jgi:hypothetical protein